MTDVNDRHELNDREPGEPGREPPLDLEEAEAAHEQALIKFEESGAVGEENTEMVLRHLLPKALAELRAARERIAEFEALEKREEWAVTLGEAPPNPADPIQDGDFGEAAMDLARKHKGQAWRRVLTVHPWEPISDKAPF